MEIPVVIKEEPSFEEISIKEENYSIEDNIVKQEKKVAAEEESEFLIEQESESIPMSFKLEENPLEGISVSSEENYQGQATVTSIAENEMGQADPQSTSSTLELTHSIPKCRFSTNQTLTGQLALADFSLCNGTKPTESTVSGQNLTCVYCPASFSCKNLLSKHLRQPYENLAKAMGKAPENFTGAAVEAADPLMRFRVQLRKNLLRRNEGLSSEVAVKKPRLSTYKIHQCEECGATFPHDSNLRRHRLTHTGEKPWACDKCPARFNQKGNLQTHQRTRHSFDRPYVCMICNATFNCKATLKGHLISHSGQRMFECTLCPTKFMRKRSLEEHMRGHSGERPYVCHICNADFNHRGSFTLHMRMHTNDKRYACAHCPARFIQRVSLQLHMQKHTGIKPHKCTICGACFGLKSHLQAHHLTHTGEKPWKCDICDEKFARKAYVVYHRRTHTGEKPYRCHLCDAKFSSKKGWKNHILAHTEEEEEEQAVLEDVPGVSAESGIHFLQPLAES